jgi:hypothetical protein
VPQGPLPATLAQAFGAVALFVDRARCADARFVLADADAPSAIELCRQLDGLPLAIELAAARAPLLGLRQLLDSMQHRLQLLTRNPDAAAPARQQTLRAALEWSLTFLDERERAVFRRLGVMVDGASLELIVDVVADDQGPLDRWAVVDALGSLVERSLVAVLIDDDGRARYRLLESPRLLALEWLDAAGERDTRVRRHAHCVAALFDAAWDRRFSGQTGLSAWSRAVLQDAGNARAAIAWARAASEPDTVVAVTASLCAALPPTSHAERMDLGDLCEALADAVQSPRLRQRALLMAVRPMHHPSQQQSLALAGRALALARELQADAGDRWLRYHALAEWIHAAAVVARPALEPLREALVELQAIEDPRWPPQRLARGSGARRLARAAFRDSAQPAEQLELTRRWMADLAAAGADTTPSMGTLIDAELEAGNIGAAVLLGERVLEQLAGSRDEWSLLMVRLNLANALLLAGDVRRARPLLQAAWPAAQRFGVQAWAADGSALLAALERRPRTAARLAGYADATYSSRDLIRHPVETAVPERSAAIAGEALGQPAFDRLRQEGSRMSGEQFAPDAFATRDTE